MFRRRAFWLRRLIRPRRAFPEPLRRAMWLFEQGEFAQAAEAFDHLAQEAEERGMLFQAANLTLQAARAYMRLDNLDLAYDRAMKGLELFKRSGQPVAVRQPERLVEILRQRGRHSEAEALEREMQDFLIAMPPGARRGELPAKCPQCGAPIKESEVAWVGPSSAECPYCGSVVKAER